MNESLAFDALDYALLGTMGVLALAFIATVIVLLRRRDRVVPPVAQQPRAVRLREASEMASMASAMSDDVEITKIAAFNVAQKIPSLIEEDADDDAEPTNISKEIFLFEDDIWRGVEEPTGVEDLVAIKSAGETDRGVARRRNEDAFLADDRLELFVVADGMGGYAGGDVASQMAVEEISEAIRGGIVGSRPELPRRAAELVAAIEKANSAVFTAAKGGAKFEGMGTTIVAVRVAPKKERVYIAYVGDSRVYRLRNGTLRQLTCDHTLAARGVTGPLASNLRRAVGVAPTVKVDTVLDKTLPGDVLLLCSDGLSKMLPDHEIRRLLSESDDNLARTANSLIAAANGKGGRDNITVVLVKIRDAAAKRWSPEGQYAHA